MTEINITSLSSRGQIVIPLKIRQRMKLEEGEKFVVIDANDVLVLKKIEKPSFKGFDELLKKSNKFAKNKGLTEKEINEAVKRARR